MLLKKKKEFTMLRDQICQERCNLSWGAVDKEYACSTLEDTKADKLGSLPYIAAELLVGNLYVKML
jgi:predicted dithiol-disulfide oxidoreductase (DUF899 family)